MRRGLGLLYVSRFLEKVWKHPNQSDVFGISQITFCLVLRHRIFEETVAVTRRK